VKKKLNQKITDIINYYNLSNLNIIYSNLPINRLGNHKEISLNGTKHDKLIQLKLKIENIKNCELKKNATKIVFSDGNINSNIMIVGEGPGAQEDKIGTPFVGRAGQLLDKMLKAINLDRKKVYITNVVNYRPPSNRKPTLEEINRYLPFLITHIETIKPKILVLLGSTALNAILGDKEVISKARGKWVKKEFNVFSTWIISSFHPAFLMRQPDQKKLSWIDLKMIKKKMNELKIIKNDKQRNI
tara:strand:+ start:90 stop:821 length:732 start_codon:yes stop_codon:yes gene_type:complete